MERKRQELPPVKDVPRLRAMEKERIEFDFRRCRRGRRWVRIYCATCALTAVLAILVLVCLKWNAFEASSGDTPKNTLSQKWEGFLLPDPEEYGKPTWSPIDPSDPQSPSLTPEKLYQFDYTAVPDGEIPILPMDLSLTDYGASYIHNLTGLNPDTEALLRQSLKQNQQPEYLSASQGPLVLIVHTHGTEAYSPNGAISYADDGSEIARSSDSKQNVVGVGRVLADSLNRAGISTLHCTILHDELQYKDSYARAEETIRQYLEQYPSIRLVIDVHRDSILKSTGEMVRPVSLIDGEAAAQVMCVVGSNWGGEDNPNWEGNLALALQLRQGLNQTYSNLCRPPYLKSSTYNQELAPYSVLLEIGASGNSFEEAERSAEAIARILSTIIPDL